MLNALIVWNVACQSPPRQPNSGTNTAASTAIPTTSQASATTITSREIPLNPPSREVRLDRDWLSSSRRIARLGRPMSIPMAERTKTANTIRPSPPSWISPAITACPKTVNALPVSSTTSPVTVTAETEVKNASLQPTAP